MSRIINILFLLSFFPSLAFPDQVEYLFPKANQLYEEGRYQEAIQEYEKILAARYESGELYYNLGNAYFKLRDIGRAILNYERAKRLSPKDEDVEFNLQIANLSVVDKITVPPQFFLFKILSDFKNYFDLDQLSLIVLTLYLAIMITLIVRIILRKRTVQRISTFLLVPLIVLLIISAITLGIRIHENKTTVEGIIIVDKVDVVSSPGEDGTEVFSLHQGVKVRIQEVSGDWMEIRLADGKVGWIRKDSVEKI